MVIYNKTSRKFYKVTDEEAEVLTSFTKFMKILCVDPSIIKDKSWSIHAMYYTCSIGTVYGKSIYDGRWIAMPDCNEDVVEVLFGEKQ